MKLINNVKKSCHLSFTKGWNKRADWKNPLDFENFGQLKLFKMHLRNFLMIILDNKCQIDHSFIKLEQSLKFKGSVLKRILKFIDFFIKLAARLFDTLEYR